MSYILDALRKSDQLRQRGAAPTLLMGQSVAVAPKQPAYLAYGLLAAVLLGAGIAIGWLHPWRQEPSTFVPVPAAAAPVAPAIVAAPARTPAPARVQAPPSADSKASAGGRAEAPAKPRDAVAAAPGKGKAEVPEPAPGAAEAAPAPNVVALAELPLALQQELPPMTISVHAYSGRPADRLVGINNRMLREGDELVPGLRLEQITPEGMVFGYKGYSFRRGVK